MAAISGGGVNIPMPAQNIGSQAQPESRSEPDALTHSESEPSKLSTGEPVAGGPEGVANEDIKQAQIITSFAAQVMGNAPTISTEI
jgi:hypothetical protein